MKCRTLTGITAMTLFVALVMPVWTTAQDNPSPEHKPKHQQYKLLDLGTLGGPNSFVNGSPPPMINNQGTVAGEADISVMCAYLPSAGLASPGFKWQNGSLSSIGTIGNGCFNLPNAISSNGTIAGAGDIGVIDPIYGPLGHAYVWRNGQIVDLGTFGGPFSLANAVNNRGQATGGAENTDPDLWNFGGLVGLPSPTAWHGFLWQGGILTDLGTLGGPDSAGVVINESGQITGFSFTNDVPNPTTGIPTVDPFLWHRGRMTDLGTLGGTFGVGNAVNNGGQVVGFSDLTGDLANHAFVWERGVLTDIGTLGGVNSTANWINDAGQVVGSANLPDGTHHAFVWWNGKMTDLGTIGSDPCSNGFHINSSGQVVGTTADCHGTVLHAYLWEQGSMLDLNAFIGPDFTSVEPIAISDAGKIVGNGVLSNGDVHAVVLKPDGDCDSNCENRIAASQNSAAAAAQTAGSSNTAVRKRTPSTSLERLRNQMKQRYHIPGQPTGPRD